MNPIIKIENLSKQYRLGIVSTGTLTNDLKRWWYKIRGKEDPFLKIGETNERSTKGESDYVWALKDINLEVMPGEILGIIGKNGAGKSTLLKILSKVTGPTTGSISFNGRIGSLLEVGTGFHPELTGRENIFLNGAILGMTKAEIRSKLDEIIEFSGVARYVDTPVKRYSSGMMVRLGFAVAAHLEPEILVVDEVLAVGDAEFQKKAIGKMQDVSKNEGRTVLFVSHNMGAIESLCPKSILISDGKIGKIGKTKDVINHYLKNKDQDNSFEKINNLLADNKKQIIINDVKLESKITSDLNYKCNTIVFDILFEAFEEILNPGFLIIISNLNGVELFKLSNDPVSNFKIDTVFGKGRLRLRVHNLPLLGGTYNLSFAINQPYMKNYVTYNNVSKLELLSSDVYNAGIVIDNTRGFVTAKHDWEIYQEAE